MRPGASRELKVLMIAALDGDGGAYRALLGDLRLRLTAYFGRRLQGATRTSRRGFGAGHI